eukprot:8173560-Pyramimonas_sp.AAC.1
MVRGVWLSGLGSGSAGGASTPWHVSPNAWLTLPHIYNITSLYGPSCANNGKGALNTSEEKKYIYNSRRR